MYSKLNNKSEINNINFDKLNKAWEYFSDCYGPDGICVKLNKAVEFDDFKDAYNSVKKVFELSFPECKFFYESDERVQTLDYLMRKYPGKYIIDIGGFPRNPFSSIHFNRKIKGVKIQSQIESSFCFG